MNESGERWLPVPGCEGFYEVSDLGRMRSVPRWVNSPILPGSRRFSPGRVLRPAPNKDGYLSVVLSCNGHRRTRAVHTLVMLAFEGPCPEGMEVRHNDDDPGNCRHDNLQYGTSKENSADCIARDRVPRGSRHINSKLTEGQVMLIRARNEPQRVLAAEYGITQSAVSRIKSRTRGAWSHI